VAQAPCCSWQTPSEAVQVVDFVLELASGYQTSLLVADVAMLAQTAAEDMSVSESSPDYY
jgi:hypothetical protein